MTHDRKQSVDLTDSILRNKFIIFDYVPIIQSLVIFLDYKTMVVNTLFEVIEITITNFNEYKIVLYGMVAVSNITGELAIISYENADEFKSLLVGKKVISWKNLSDNEILLKINSSEKMELHYKESNS